MSGDAIVLFVGISCESGDVVLALTLSCPAHLNVFQKKIWNIISRQELLQAKEFTTLRCRMHIYTRVYANTRHGGTLCPASHPHPL